jgi:hypothetical protein
MRKMEYGTFQEMQSQKEARPEINEPKHFYDVDNAYADAVYQAAVDFSQRLGAHALPRAESSGYHG